MRCSHQPVILEIHYIIGCSMQSDAERRYWTYVLSNDPPAPWHYGKTSFAGIRGDELRLEKPEPGA